jgi:ATP-binding cassette subfamily B (MDR/TAP) protein 1
MRSIRAWCSSGSLSSLSKSLLTQNARAAGIKSPFVEGCTHSVVSSLIYLSEAVLFYVGAIFVARGTHSYHWVVEVLNLMVFTVSFGTQLMGFGT